MIWGIASTAKGNPAKGWAMSEWQMGSDRSAAGRPADLDAELRALLATAGSIGRDLSGDAVVRAAYERAAEAAANEISSAVQMRRISPEAGARQAVAARNALLEASRTRTSAAMRAVAQRLKAEGKTFEELIERYARRLYDKPPAALTTIEREAVVARILERAAIANPSVSATMRHLGRAGRGLVALSLGMALYNIYTAEDPLAQTGREAAGLGAGLLGTAVGGAIGSLACGPAAPVCMGIFVVVGGASFALGVDLAIWGGN